VESHPRSLARSAAGGGVVGHVVAGATTRHTGHVLAGEGLLLGDDLIVWILLSLGGALFVGNVMALVRPPEGPRDEGDLEVAPRGRSIFMAAIGLVVAVAALAALFS
jgi:hypothetical protein